MGGSNTGLHHPVRPLPSRPQRCTIEPVADNRYPTYILLLSYLMQDAPQCHTPAG